MVETNNYTSVLLVNIKNVISCKIIVSVLTLLVGIIWITSFMNAIIITTSYFCGFLIGYLILKFNNEIGKVISYLLVYFGYSDPADNSKVFESPKINNCDVCETNGCLRHSKYVNHEPWNGLYVHKQLDVAIEEFYNTILRTFVTDWYSKLTKEKCLLVELRFLLRFASSSLLQRALKINIGHLITRKLVPCALRHYAVCSEAERLMRSKGYRTLQEAAIKGPLKYSLHPALTSRQTELNYLKSITKAIMPYLLPQQEIDCKILNILIREIFSGWVLLSLTDVLADPEIINTLVILATGDEKMSKLPEHPKHQVEFLQNFVQNDRYKRLRLFSVDVSEILKNQEYLYAFMQFMKSAGKVNLIRFCLDIDAFNKKILQPDLSLSEKVSLFNNAWDIYLMYFVQESPSYIPFAKENLEQLVSILSGGADAIIKLQTSRALFQAYDHVFLLLDQEWAPKFFDSEHFYKLVCGMKSTTEDQKKSPNQKPDKNPVAKIGSQISKLKDALKTQTIDGKLLESIDSSIKVNNDTDLTDGVDIDLQYSHILADYARLKEKDLTTWRVTIEDMKDKKINHKSGMFQYFTINVQKSDPLCLEEESRWSVHRTDADFLTLKAKLVDFHGETEMSDAHVPSKRAKAAVEVRKKKYEVFLQNLLLKPILKSSDLLHLFLTADDDFCELAEKARPESSSISDLENIYQNFTHKLRKEKGQHLDTFMNTFLFSTDVDYYNSLKEGKNIDNGEDATIILNTESKSNQSNVGRCITDGIFGDNLGIQKNIQITLTNKKKDFKVIGFSQCLIFMLKDVFKVRKGVVSVSGTLCTLGKPKLDELFDTYLNYLLFKVLSPPRLAHLINLGEEILFEHKIPRSKKSDADEKIKMARTQLHTCFPFLFTRLLGANFLLGVDNLFDYLQNPLLNKQLIYNLLDVILCELFPELEDVT